MIATATQPVNRLSRLAWPARDTSLQAIDQFNDDSKWTIRRGVPVFAANEVRDEDGKLLKVDKAKLLEIAANTNRREQEVGEACPLMLGHVPWGQKVPEAALGDVVGYARNFRVGYFGAKKQLGILADLYFLPQHYARALQFPRRSAELWLSDWILDPIALLKRTPRQNLGTLLPGGEEGCVQELLKAGSDGCSLLTYSRGPDRRVYQLESEDRMDVPSILAKLDELRAMIAGEDGMEQNAMPSGTNAAPPDLLGGGGGPMQFSKEDYEKALKERDQFRLLYQKADRTTKLEKLVAAGYHLSVKEELQEGAGLDDKGFERHLDRIRRCYARTEKKPDDAGGFIPTGDGPEGAGIAEDKLDDYQWYDKNRDRVMTYAREHKLDDLAEATKRCRLAR